MKRRLSFAIILAAFISLSSSAQTKGQKDDLNGKTFVINLTETDKKSGRNWPKDEISFTSGGVKLKTMNEHESFPETKCKTTTDSSPTGEKTKFVSEMKNGGSSKIKLNGTISDNNIEGTILYKNAQGHYSYSFTGTLKTK